MTSRILLYNTSRLADVTLSSALGVDENNSLTFDNKYFSVTVHLVFSDHIPVEEISETVEAFVFLVEEPVGAVGEVLNCVDQKFSAFLEEVDPEVKLLVLNASESKFEAEFLEWCVERGFEFIKYVVPEEEEEEADNYGLMGQAEGVERIRAALECHMWPYRTMKGGKSENIDSKNEDFGDFVSVPNQALGDFQSLLEGDELGEDFESMFANMAKIKEVADQLPDEDRKKFAENVAMSFWRALGGSDDEVDEP